MRDFLLPFALSIPLAVPLLWYHLDGLDPVEVASPSPSQTAIDFADTRDLVETQQKNLAAPHLSRLEHEDPSFHQDHFDQTVEAASPGY